MKKTVFIVLKNVGFYDKIPKIGLKSAVKDALYNLPKAVFKIQNHILPAVENTSDEIQGEGAKITIPGNIIDICTKPDILLGLNLSSHTDTLTEASKLVDELYKRGEIQNKQQHRYALNKFHI